MSEYQPTRTYGEVYQRIDGMYDWRLVANNGEIVATSGGQGFTEHNDATEALMRLEDWAAGMTEIREG